MTHETPWYVILNYSPLDLLGWAVVAFLLGVAVGIWLGALLQKMDEAENGGGGV